ncbi:MAG: beta-N-acetylhexosaminidase [Pseudomonadota bacterium]
MPAGAYIFGCSGAQLRASEAAFFRDANPWGFILFARNIESPDQLRELTDQLREAVGWRAPILIDQEGGRVQRMGPPHWRSFLPALDQIASTGEKAARAFYLRNRLIASELHAVGLDVNCAPLADVIRTESHPVLRNRCYGDTPELVTEFCKIAVQAFLDGGVLPVLKHIPGYGRASVDGHMDLPSVDVPQSELDEVDFSPFRALRDVAMGMTAHIVFSSIDDEPATISPKVMTMIREEIGFKGLIMTDDISMQALSGTVAHRSEKALAAGCDMVLHCNGDLAEMTTVADKARMLDAAGQARADIALSQRQEPSPVDIPALEAEFQTLIEG